MSIESTNFYMTPKELHNTDMSLPEVYLYSRMLDDYDYWHNIKKLKYAPSHAYLAALIQSKRAQTAGTTIDKLIARGLVIDMNSTHGGRKVYEVRDWKDIPDLITLPTIQERREKATHERQLKRLTESVNRTDAIEVITDERLTESVNREPVESSRLTESVEPVNGKREPRLTESVNMSDEQSNLIQTNKDNNRVEDKIAHEEDNRSFVSSSDNLLIPSSQLATPARRYTLADVQDTTAFSIWDISSNVRQMYPNDVSKRIEHYLETVAA